MEEPINYPPRLDFLEYGTLLAYTASLRATCRRKLVGCALFNNKRVVKATGFNGAFSGAPQCDDIGCLMVDGHCMRAVHAERNAIMFSGDSDLAGGYCFITILPCRDCFNLIAAVGIKNVYYLEDYRNDEHKVYLERVANRDSIVLNKLALAIPQILEKALEFHKGPGGLFVNSQLLEISDKPMPLE